MEKLTLQQFMRFLKEYGMHKIYLSDLKRLKYKTQAKDVENLIMRYNANILSYSFFWGDTKYANKYDKLDEKLKMVSIKLSSQSK